MLSARRAYQLSGLVGLLLTAVLGYQAARLPYYTRIGPGPGFFPAGSARSWRSSRS